MRGAEVAVLGPADPAQVGPATAAASGGPLARAAADAVARGRECAAARLAGWLPPAAVERLGGYFEDASVHQADGRRSNGGPRFELEAFLSRLCSRPRTVYSAGGETGSAELELRTEEGPTDGSEYGTLPEPDSPRVLFSPARLDAALANGLSLGVRQFDRQFPEWAPAVDDVACVSGGDIFTKAFVAGGDESVTAWHRDQSDVVVTMLAGVKRFEVAPTTARDEPEPEVEVSAELSPQAALVLPRSRAHCATPVGSISVLLSIGVMRHADWAFRSVVPSHLGFAKFPSSPSVYRVMLRSHVPAAITPREPRPDEVWRSRAPGGLVVLAEGRDGIEIAVLGMKMRLSEAAFGALLALQGAGVRSTGDIAAEAGLGATRGGRVVAELVAAELAAPAGDPSA